MTTNPAQNHHADAAQDGYYFTEPQRQIEATLALAYEQRTANLIALWADLRNPGDEMSGIDYGRLATQIKERLGLKP